MNDMALKRIWPKVHLWKRLSNSCLVIYTLYSLIHVINTEHTSAVCTDSSNVQSIVESLSDCCHKAHANKSYQLFCEVMSQFDCRTRYSVKWNCSDCLKAYTRWLSAVFEHNESNGKLCDDVLAKCPYIAPNNSYGDTPAFDCSYSGQKWNCTEFDKTSGNYCTQ